MPFPFMANMDESIDEVFAYLTDVMTADNTMEQRVQLREIPLRAIEFGVFLDERHAQYVNTLFHAWQGQLLGVPLWHFGNRLGATLSIGGTVITVDTTSIPHEVDGLVFVWTNVYTWEVLTIESFNATTVTVAAPGAIKNWTVESTYVVPMRMGYIPREQDFDWHDLKLGKARIGFELETVV